MTRLLSRWAESLFWLARYIERAENLARILDVQETFARDSGGEDDWRLVLVINADEQAFAARYPEALSANVLRFYLTDRTNPTSILSDIFAARENARALRPLISTEMWTQLNMLHNRLLALKPEEVVAERLNGICDWIKRGCDAHTGITAGTFYRDEAWCFYQLGAAIECADQTTRLLDAKFLNFMASSDPDPGSPADSFYWAALLRAAAGHQAFRRRHPRGMAPEQVAAFLLCDPSFPRSVACNLGIVFDHLTNLRRHHGLRAATPALQFLDEIHDDLEVRKVKTVIAHGDLHRFNDFLQRSFSELSRLIGEGFFGHPPASAGERAVVVSPARRSGAWEPGQVGPVERGPNEPSRTPARMTHLEVRHATVYRYAQPVRLGQHRAMLRPRDSHDLKLRSATLAVTPTATVRWVHDVFGNSVTLLDFTEPATELRLESRITLEHYPLEQPDYPIAARAERWPFAYSADERVDLGPTLARYYPDDGDRVRGWAMDLLGGREMGSMELLVALTKGIKESLRYSARDEEGTQEPLETIERGGGSCRDYALLMMEAVRSLGFAARFVTGYLYDPALDGGAVGMQGAGATHAWAQVYLPGAGWIEFDPTNGIIGGKNLIRVGVSRDPKQAVPVAGTFTGPPGAFAGLEVDVQVTCVDPDRVS